MTILPTTSAEAFALYETLCDEHSKLCDVANAAKHAAKRSGTIRNRLALSVAYDDVGASGDRCRAMYRRGEILARYERMVESRAARIARDGVQYTLFA